MSDLNIDSWGALGAKLQELRGLVSKSKAINLNEGAAKAEAKDIVQYYFRHCRPELTSLRFDDEMLRLIDDAMQRLLKLTNGNSRRAYYKGVLRILGEQHFQIAALREKQIGLATITRYSVSSRQSPQEAKILSTLQEMVPTAALSYEQACRDLGDTSRISLRGVANELRECLRELLDHLAPDADVEAQPGYKFESDQKKPTMKQKVRFILRARGLPASASEVPENAALLADEMVGKLTRSTYNRSSISAHVSTARSEVCQMKMYIDSVLAELLEIHRER
jgi:hypothetical protein